MPMGRSGRRPCPVKTAGIPRAAAIGIRKRSVDPLSPQSSETVPVGRVPAETVHTPFSRTARTPSACAAHSVARISSDRARGERILSVSPGDESAARAAQRMARCAALFEGGASTQPFRRPGRSVTRSASIAFTVLPTPRRLRGTGGQIPRAAGGERSCLRSCAEERSANHRPAPFYPTRWLPRFGQAVCCLRRAGRIFQQRGNLFRCSRFRQSHVLTQVCHQHHADPNGSPVRQTGVAVRLFQRVAQRVAEVEHHPFPGVKFIVLHEFPLAVHAGKQNGFHLRRQIGGVPKRIKQRAAADAAILDDLSHAV